MTHRFRHAHPCQACGAKTPCDGELAENYDGEPPIICRDFHLPSGARNADFICEACQWAREDAATAPIDEVTP